MPVQCLCAVQAFHTDLCPKNTCSIYREICDGYQSIDLLSAILFLVYMGSSTVSDVGFAHFEKPQRNKQKSFGFFNLSYERDPPSTTTE